MSGTPVSRTHSGGGSHNNQRRRRDESSSRAVAASSATVEGLTNNSSNSSNNSNSNNPLLYSNVTNSSPSFRPLEEYMPENNQINGSREHGNADDDDDDDDVARTILFGKTTSNGTVSSSPLLCGDKCSHHHKSHHHHHAINSSSNNHIQCNAKTAITTVMASTVLLVIWDATMRNPHDRWIQAAASEQFLEWVQAHPVSGLLAILLVIATAVVFMIPIGTPLTLGCGFIYKGAYGWRIGLTVATMVAMGGSALGAVTCFLLGRYLMRDQVRKWVRKYPLFDAIDVAAAEHGLRIMAMLYLTPILPLGPVSYMCGTTSMALSSFVLAKIASLPLMLLYAFIGASTGALIGNGQQSQRELEKIEQNETLIVSGILLSCVMIAGITHFIKKELHRILERQEKHKPGELDFHHNMDEVTANEEAALELGVTAPRQRRNV